MGDEGYDGTTSHVETLAVLASIAFVYAIMKAIQYAVRNYGVNERMAVSLMLFGTFIAWILALGHANNVLRGDMA